jgi:hypothetical protein
LKEFKLNTNAKLFFIKAGGLSVTSLAGHEKVRKWQVKLAVLKKNEAKLRFYGAFVPCALVLLLEIPLL